MVGSDVQARIGFGQLALRDEHRAQTCDSLAAAVSVVLARPTGIVSVRGGNGAGKSSLLTALKCHFRGQAYYLPAHDRLAYRFNVLASAPLPPSADADDDEDEEPEDIVAEEAARERSGYSSGERQLAVLAEIVQRTAAPLYLLDEWDANLDPANRQRAMRLVEQLAQRARVVEISHRDPGDQSSA